MGAAAPVRSLPDTEPALLLQKIEENNLAHEFLGKIDRVDVFFFELVFDGLLFASEPSEGLFDFLKKAAIFLIKLLGDCFDTESLLDFTEAWVGVDVLEKGKEPGLRSVAILALAHDVREAASRSKPGLHSDRSAIFLDGG